MSQKDTAAAAAATTTMNTTPAEEDTEGFTKTHGAGTAGVDDQSKVFKKTEANGRSRRNGDRLLSPPPPPSPAMPLPDALKREKTLRLDEGRIQRMADYVAKDILALPSAADLPHFTFARTVPAGGGRGGGSSVPASSFRPGAVQRLLRAHPTFCDMYVALIREEIGPALLDAAFARSAPETPDSANVPASARASDACAGMGGGCGGATVKEPASEEVTLLYQFPPTLRVKEPREGGGGGGGGGGGHHRLRVPLEEEEEEEEEGEEEEDALPAADQSDPRTLLDALTIATDERAGVKGKVELGTVRPHSDDEYGHQTGEVNFWLPLTPLDDGADNTLWAESAPGRGDWHPFAPLGLGEAKRFWGTHVRHFALDTPHGGGGGGGGDAPSGGRSRGRKTRVSIDFRCCVREHFDADWRVPGVVYQHERRSMCFVRSGDHVSRAAAASSSTTSSAEKAQSWVARLDFDG